MLSETKNINEEKFTDVDWRKLCIHIDQASLIEKFEELSSNLKAASKNQTDLQKSVLSLQRARNQLKIQYSDSTYATTGICPFCGHDWIKAEDLNTQFEKTNTLISSVIGRENVRYSKLLGECKNLFKSNCEQILLEMLNRLQSDIGLMIFSQFSSWQSFQQYIDIFIPALSKLGISLDELELETTLESSIANAEKILIKINSIKDSIPSEYYAANEIYDFSHLYKENTSFIDSEAHITSEEFDEKKEYVRYCYYSSFVSIKSEYDSLCIKENKIKNIVDQLRDYSHILNEAIKDYQMLMIMKIEIPFFCTVRDYYSPIQMDKGF